MFGFLTQNIGNLLLFLTLMREDVYAHSGMRLLDNLNFQSDEFSESQSSVGQQ